MLTKLIKHEFRATGRIMLPLYLVLIATAFGANLSTRGMLSTRYRLLDILGGLLVTAFALAIFGVCLMSFVLMIQRFYKNLLQDEGYLSMTLPVSVHQHIWAKLIVSAVWFALTVLAVIAASFIVAYDVRFLHQLWTGLRDLFGYALRNLDMAVNGAALTAEFLVLCFVASFAMCLQFYAALAAGHSLPNHKMAWSVAWFFVFQFVFNFLIGSAATLASETGFDAWLAGLTSPSLRGAAALHAALWTLTILSALYGAVFYAVTVYFLKRKLNLE